MGNLDKVSSNEVNDTIDKFKYNSTTGKLEAETSISGKSIDLSDELQAYFKGRLSYDPNSLTVLADTGIDGVRVNLGQEEMYLICNNSGGPIANGKAVYASGVDAGSGCLEGDLADATSFFTSAQVLGLATHTIPDATIGLVTVRGIVRDFDTSTLGAGLVWLDTLGTLTNDQPLYPKQRIFMGILIKAGVGDGMFQVSISRITRNDISKAYPFTSSGILSGTYWISGYYDFNATSVTLSQASLTQVYGIGGIKRGAHAGIVTDGTATVDSGQVGLRVVGIRDYEDGTVQQVGQVGIITDDITTLSANTYYETFEKFSGEISFELYIVSGTPTVYSIPINFGFSKYDDLQDRDYTIKGFESKWQGNANSSFDVAVIKHTSAGWTFASSGFIAGNGDVCRKTVDAPLAGDVGNGLDGAYKRVNINAYIAGQSGEGHVIQIITGANSTMQIMSNHIDVVSEEIDF